MSSVKFLLDTNVLIGLEDAKQIEVSFAELRCKCSEHGVRIFLHEACEADVQRDRDATRRAITLSKVKKFEVLRGIPVPEAAVLGSDFGAINKSNDLIDATLLHALKVNIADFLVTEDIGLHRRADHADLGSRVFTVQGALAWLRQTFEPKAVRLPYIEDRKVWTLDCGDEIFDGLRSDYPGFDAWFAKCVAEHRDCWTITSGGELGGLVIRNEESHAQAEIHHKGPKILKLCTFKLKEKFRGEKFGEQLLKQALWFAQRNGFDLVYLTAFTKQTFLIRLLQDLGFDETLIRSNGELVLEKVIGRGPVELKQGEEPLTIDRQHYPRFYDGPKVRKFCVPIKCQYHRKLFPETVLQADVAPALPNGAGGARTPGNTIRKIYLCRTPNRAISPGDLLLFYMSKSQGHSASQSITTVGVVESVNQTSDPDELLRLTGKRSVFSAGELEEMAQEKPVPVKTIDFLLVGHLDESVPLNCLIDHGVLKAPPQSISQVLHTQYMKLKKLLRMGFEF